jgi:uncharacterized protein
MDADITLADSARLAAACPPWWRFGMVWFALSGPALVIVAGFATMAIAFVHADTELHEPTPVSAFSMRMGAESRLPIGPSAKAAVDPARQRPAVTPH